MDTITNYIDFPVIWSRQSHCTALLLPRITLKSRRIIRIHARNSIRMYSCTIYSLLQHSLPVSMKFSCEPRPTRSIRKQPTSSSTSVSVPSFFLPRQRSNPVACQMTTTTMIRITNLWGNFMCECLACDYLWIFVTN